MEDSQPAHVIQRTRWTYAHCALMASLRLLQRDLCGWNCVVGDGDGQGPMRETSSRNRPDHVAARCSPKGSGTRAGRVCLSSITLAPPRRLKQWRGSCQAAVTHRNSRQSHSLDHTLKSIFLDRAYTWATWYPASPVVASCPVFGHHPLHLVCDGRQDEANHQLATTTTAIQVTYHDRYCGRHCDFALGRSLDCPRCLVHVALQPQLNAHH